MHHKHLGTRTCSKLDSWQLDTVTLHVVLSNAQVPRDLHHNSTCHLHQSNHVQHVQQLANRYLLVSPQQARWCERQCQTSVCTAMKPQHSMSHLITSHYSTLCYITSHYISYITVHDIIKQSVALFDVVFHAQHRFCFQYMLMCILPE